MHPLPKLAACLLVCAASPAVAADGGVGFQRLHTPSGTEIAVWYPAKAEAKAMSLGLYTQQVAVDAPPPKGGHALVVMSHGTGGDFAGNSDTAYALAKAGFIVAALTHPGDNRHDQSRATDLASRPRALSAVIDYMLTDWGGRAAVDPGRIGAFGFSAGGFTVLAAAGGKPDFSLMAAHCAARPTSFDCKLVADRPRPAPQPWTVAADRRIKALVVAAPALGFTFSSGGLNEVRIPVQLWRANDDKVLPAPDYADAVRAALPVAPQFHAVAGAGHFDFLSPCRDAAMMPLICSSAPGFDRTAFHQEFNTRVAKFLRKALARR